jgi:hypothetical protein
VHWRSYLKFPDNPSLSLEAKDLICRLLCDVDHRIGSGGADQIKVSYFSLLRSDTVIVWENSSVYSSNPRRVGI